MRYTQIRECDVSNGEGVGVALFVQGCHFHCNNCFNPETWDFNGGKEWTQEVKEAFIELANRPYIKRISILGGEPLTDENLDDVLDLVNEIRLSSPQKNIWLYTGYEWKHIFDPKWHYHPKTQEKLSIGRWRRQQIIRQCDVVVDGQYMEFKRDITLKWCGSSNQHVIDIQRSLQEGEIVIWET
ncbi:MAG: anaerobic ribonucleoside-triphosphate reductase activating protein [Ruminococcus flavefaciens]|nr:anaerobic ribonucleoside-triphosphate reductase activating protein [Ruminococcus flavefaciens]